MRVLLSNSVMRLVYWTVPFLLMADLTRALGGSISISWLVFAVLVPLLGLAVDVVRLRRSQTGDTSLTFASEENRPFQFNLRMILFVFLFASIYFSFRFSGAVRQKRIVTELRTAGVPITYDHQTATALEGVFGPEMFGTVQKVTLRSDDEVTKILALSGVSEVELTGPGAWGPGVTDVAIKALIASPQLKKITLDNNPNVTDAAVSLLKKSLPNCNVEVYPR